MGFLSWIAVANFFINQWKLVLTLLLVCAVGVTCYFKGRKVRPRPPVTFKGEVSSVPDGNHVIVRIGLRRRICRLAHISVPENSTKWGQEAQNLLTDMVLDKEVEIALTEGGRLSKRVAGVVYTPGYKCANVELLEQGLAKYVGGADDTWQEAEERAQRAKRGIWESGKAIFTPCPWPDAPEVDSDWAEPIEVLE